MKRVTRLAPLALVLMMLSLNVAVVRAGQELNLTLVGSSFYCLVDPSCTVTGTETMSTFTLPGTVGEGVLYTRTFAASPGSPAEGAYGYEYRIDLANVDSVTTYNCINTFRIKLGAPLSILDYNGDGVAGDQVYMFFEGGKIPISSAVREGPFVTFKFFLSPLCPGPPAGQTSVVFGVLASGPPKSVLADLQAFEGVVQAAARAPNLTGKASFKFTLLYDTIATLPPNGFIAPSLNAGEGRRQALLNRVNAALALAEDDNALPAVQLLERLLLLTDGDGDDWVQDDPATRVNEQMNLAVILNELIETLQDSRR